MLQHDTGVTVKYSAYKHNIVAYSCWSDNSCNCVKQENKCYINTKYVCVTVCAL